MWCPQQIFFFFLQRYFSCLEEKCDWWLHSCMSLDKALKPMVQFLGCEKNNIHLDLTGLLGGLHELTVHIKHMDQCPTHSQCSINTSNFDYYHYYCYLYHYNNYCYYYWKAISRILEKKFQQWYLSIIFSLSILAQTISGKLTLSFSPTSIRGAKPVISDHLLWTGKSSACFQGPQWQRLSPDGTSSFCSSMPEHSWEPFLALSFTDQGIIKHPF